MKQRPSFKKDSTNEKGFGNGINYQKIIAELQEKLEVERTARQKLEEKLQNTQVSLDKFFALSPLSTVLTNVQTGQYAAINEAFLAQLGYERDEVVGRTALELGIWDDPADRQKFIQLFSETGSITNQEFKFRTKSGELRYASTSATTVELADANYILSIYSDLTESKQTEKKLHDQSQLLRQFQKLEALGRLAGGIAHDFNNFLTVIIGYANIALENVAEDNPLYNDLEQVNKTALRASKLAKQLLAFSRQQVMQPEETNLNQVIEDLQPILTRLVEDNITLTLNLEANLGQVIADPTQLDQVLLNLVVNARDAISGKGKVLIETANVELDHNWHQDLKAGSYVMLSLTDNGCGMDDDTMSHIFEPFFTTKAPDKGTGFGLSMVYGVVKQSGGTLWVYSEPGIGTTFKIYLPRVYSKKDKLKTSQLITKGTETVLLVEDEEVVRTLVRSVLEEAGYTVLEVGDYRKAFEMGEKYRGKIDAVITDVIMPQMNGFRLVELLQLLNPSVKVLYMSGYPEKVLNHQGVIVGKDQFLQKPFTMHELTQKLRRLLDVPG
jgi:two-component system, cell cycle sensor histidine kinase and response regulator CckA